MSIPDPAIDRRRDPARARRIVLFVWCGILVIVAVGLLSWQTPIARRPDSTQAARAGYVGSQSCATCHPGESAAHSRSGHARTLRPAARTRAAGRLSGKTFADPERPGARWSYGLRDGQFWTERHENGEVERFVIDYAFGSGHHATTFVTLTDRTPERPTMIEHRLTAFAHKDAPDITPGQGEARNPQATGIGPSGRRYPTWSTLKCFECHATVISDRGPSALDEATMIPNVDCERCHGPARAHVEAARRGAAEPVLAMPLGPGRSTAAEEIRSCGACHRLPDMGDAAVIRPENPRLVRFQPIGLMQSACYRKSPGTLSCTTCHDAHARTSTDLPAYEAVCLSCHRAPSQTACKVSAETGCVGCHMPRRDATRGMMMTDHWIRSRPESASKASPHLSEPAASGGSDSARSRGL